MQGALKRALKEELTMTAHLVLGLVTLVMLICQLNSYFKPALPSRQSRHSGAPAVRPQGREATKGRWKAAIEVAIGGVIVVVAVGARLALAYGWLN
jgi:hypothetical protein